LGKTRHPLIAQSLADSGAGLEDGTRDRWECAIPADTGSTQAGMIAGFAAQGRADRVIGIDASGTVEQTWTQVRQIVNQTAELVGLGRVVRDDEIIINSDYAYPAYGVPSDETNEAIRLAARTEAMMTDPVYEGKSMQGMIDLTRKGFFPEGSRVLYAHLGGAPALNGYSYYYKDG
jgi:1-aminocyclopropane-1-carboxylate deaminase